MALHLTGRPRAGPSAVEIPAVQVSSRSDAPADGLERQAASPLDPLPLRPMSTLRSARTLQVAIAAPADVVYACLADPRRLAEWATGIGAAPTPLGDGTWRLETPAGPVRVTFAPPNPFGVVDHWVAPLEGTGPVVDVPLRVVPNGPSGSEVLFTLFQQPGMSDAQFAADAALVEADLARLRALLGPTPEAAT